MLISRRDIFKMAWKRAKAQAAGYRNLRSAFAAALRSVWALVTGYTAVNDIIDDSVWRMMECCRHLRHSFPGNAKLRMMRRWYGFENGATVETVHELGEMMALSAQYAPAREIGATRPQHGAEFCQSLKGAAGVTPSPWEFCDT